MVVVKYFLAIRRLYLDMQTSRLASVTGDRLTSADVMRQLAKEARDVYGSRAKFAAALDVSDEVIGRYFRGEREMPADLMFRAIDALGLDDTEFFTRARATRSQQRTTDVQ
jgi:predicted transcriptional regulator